MIRKLILCITVLVIALPGLLRAQFSVRADVGVYVASVQSLVVGSGAQRPATNTDVALSDKIDNQKNVKLGQVNQINVFSSSKFVLKVSARDDFHNQNGPEIPASAVYVSSGAIEGHPYNPADFIFEKDVNLAMNEPKALIHSQSSGSLSNSFNIEYYASGLDTEDSQHGNLDGTVVYTIEVE
jgi:hypothetical protein